MNGVTVAVIVSAVVLVLVIGIIFWALRGTKS